VEDKKGIWKSKILEGLGAARLDVFVSGNGPTARQLAVALVLSATSVISGCATTVASPETFKLPPDLLYEDLPIPSEMQSIRQNQNPFNEPVAHEAPKETFVNKAAELLSKIPFTVDREYERADDHKPVTEADSKEASGFEKTLHVITSPLEFMREKATEHVLESAEKPPMGSREITRTLSDMGGSVLTVGVTGVAASGAAIALLAVNLVSGIVHVAEVHQNVEHQKVKDALDAAQRRKAASYDAEIALLRAHDSVNPDIMPSTAHRVDISRVSTGGLDGSTEHLDKILMEKSISNKKDDSELEP
jgi:hypothetical protein